MAPPPFLSSYSARVHGELRSLLEERSQPLYRMIEYQLGWVDEHGTPVPGPGGEHLLGVLALLACEAVGGEASHALPVAASVELAAHYAQVHEDIQDGNPERARRPSVWWVWGPAQAINAGDGLHALARLALCRLEGAGVPAPVVLEALRLLDEACLFLCEGQYQDLLFLERVDLTPTAYFQMVEKKAGALPGCALEAGALVGGAGRAVRDAFRQAGRRLGVAHQVRRDLQALFSPEAREKPSPSILNKRKTLPLVYALEKGGLREKRELGSLYLKRVLEPADLPHLTSLLEGLGARTASEEAVHRLQREALSLLEGVGLPPGGLEHLRQALLYFVEEGSPS